jgi:hypothetical protein
MEKEITSRKMILDGWMSIWALKEQIPMDMEKKGMKT